MTAMHKSVRLTLGALLVITMWASAGIPSAVAQTRCPAGTSGCTVETAPSEIRDRVNEGARRVLSNPDGAGRVREAGRTVRDCLNCGMDAVRDGANRISGSGSGSK